MNDRTRFRARLVAAVQVYARTMPAWYLEHKPALGELTTETFPPLDFDYRGLKCPECGEADVLVLDLPRHGQSSVKRDGKARCNQCLAELRLPAGPPLDAHCLPCMADGHQRWHKLSGLPALVAPKDWQQAGFAVGASADELWAVVNADQEGLRLLVARLADWAAHKADEIILDDVPKPVKEIARRHGLTVKQVEAFTSRGRKKYGMACCIESPDRTVRGSKYLYKESFFRDEIARAKLRQEK